MEVLSPSTEICGRTRKLAAYQACASVQEILLISQDVQFAALFCRIESDDESSWLYRQYHATEVVVLESLDIQVPLSQLYEGLTIPAEEES